MFRTIRKQLQFEKDFRDVKIACDDNQIEAHKVIIDQNKLGKNNNLKTIFVMQHWHAMTTKSELTK